MLVNFDKLTARKEDLNANLSTGTKRNILTSARASRARHLAKTSL